MHNAITNEDINAPPAMNMPIFATSKEGARSVIIKPITPNS